MASRLISGMHLDASIVNIFSARGILTAKDALCKPELELMELLDLPMSRIKEAITHISQSACPPYRSVLTLMKERQNEIGFGRLRTDINPIDSALLGGIPFGALTEVVGPAGFGKTQLCLMLSVIATLQEEHGGLDGNVMYFDTERKFNSGRMAEIAVSRYPHIFSDNINDSLRKLATRILVYHPHSLEEFASSLLGLEEVIIENHIRLIIVDSIAALMQSEYGPEELLGKQNLLGNQVTALKYIAESFRIPILVTNQVRATTNNQLSNMGFSRYVTSHRQHDEQADGSLLEDPELQLTAALGTSWAHAVNIRLTLESISGQRFLKITKSPISDSKLFPYKVTAAGLNVISADEYRHSHHDTDAAEEFEV